jgi:signal transduction histidine kinase
VIGPAAVAISVAAVVTAAVLDTLVPGAHRAVVELEPGWIAGLAGVPLAVPGALLLRRMPRHPVAWVLLITGVHWSIDGLACSWLAYATLTDPARPGAELAFWLYQRLGASLLLSLPLVLLLYPDGRLPRGRWRVASIAGLASTSLLPLVLLVVPAQVAQDDYGQPFPAPLTGLDLDLTTIAGPDAFWAAAVAIAGAAVPLSLIVPFLVVVGRYRRSAGDPLRRARMRWLLWAAIVDVLVMLTANLLPEMWTSFGLTVAVALTGIALVIGIIRPQLLDIDRLLGGTLLYAGLAASVLLIDALVLGMARVVLGERLAAADAAIVALLVVTAIYGPLRHRLWLLVRRLVFGRRDDPYRVVAGLAEQLERSGSPEDELVAVARAVSEAFKAPYVAVEVDRMGDNVVASHGVEPADMRVLPITYRGEVVGRLRLAADGPRVALSTRDERLLGDMVRQAAFAARTAHLARELQRSREQIVTAREEERRRLRRDLHDGLGPALGGVALRIDTARNLATRAPADADKLLKQAREDVTAAVADVRRLVHDLRPPALDDVGLVGAVRQQAERMRTPGLSVSVTGTDESLPAAVEVAAYRIASEALTNIAKHAHATSADVSLAVSGPDLIVEVRDDGVGIAPGTPTGVGLVSLRERAAELGGDCRIECPDGRGTLIRARLPLGAPS